MNSHNRKYNRLICRYKSLLSEYSRHIKNINNRLSSNKKFREELKDEFELLGNLREIMNNMSPSKYKKYVHKYVEYNS